MLSTSGTRAVAANGSENVDMAGAVSPRQLFQERINSILAAPMPRCLQSSLHHDRSFRGDSREASGVSGVRVRTSPRSARKAPQSTSAEIAGDHNTNDAPATPRSAHDGSSISQGLREKETSASPSSSRLPIYEQLLQKGRQRQEHLEQLRQAAIERELRELRPAPSIVAADPTHPTTAAAQARRLPPEGQRIEDKLLQRAKDKAAQQARELQLRKAREEEDIAAVATFRPHISAHAQATKARYKEPPTDRAAWRAQRLEELAQTRQSTELEDMQELRDGPLINRRSAKLAAAKKAREGLAGLPAAEALFIAEHRRRLAQWQAAEAEREAQAHATPSITHQAALMHRGGEVGSRLHAESYDAAVRRLQREVLWREAHTPFQPEVTPLAAVTAPRYQREVEDPSNRHSGVRGGGSQSRSSSTVRESHQPTINPISAAIAERLPETPMQRLCRPSAVHSLSSYADPAQTLPAAAAATPLQSSPQPTPRRRLAMPQETTTSSAPSPSLFPTSAAASTSTSPAPLPNAVVASLDAYARRRQARLDALRREQAQQELRECTFQPQVSARSAAILAEAAQERKEEGNENTPAGQPHGPRAVAQRSEAWQQQRERHLETMRQWQAEREAAAEAAAAAAQTHHHASGKGAGASSTTSSPSRAPFQSVYGGDGRAWGVDAYLARQQLARAQREELQRQQQLGSGRSSVSANDQRGSVAMRRHASTTATPLQGASFSHDNGSIRSLRPPVSAPQAAASARLWSSFDE